MAAIRHTKIANLTPNRRGLVVDFKLIKIQAVRTVKSRNDGSTHRVADILVADETGSIILSLWDEAIDQAKEGQVFQLTGGRTTLFQGRLQLALSVNGSLQLSTLDLSEVNTKNNLSQVPNVRPKNRKAPDRRPPVRRTKGFAWSRIKRDSD